MKHDPKPEAAVGDLVVVAAVDLVAAVVEVMAVVAAVGEEAAIAGVGAAAVGDTKNLNAKRRRLHGLRLELFPGSWRLHELYGRLVGNNAGLISHVQKLH